MGVDGKNISFELEDDAEVIAMEWGIDQLKVQEMMAYMVDIGLFENSEGRITCIKLAKRLDDTNSKNPEIKRLLSSIKSNGSELLGDIQNNSNKVPPDKIRLDENREDKNINTSVAITPVKQGNQFKIPLPQTVAQYMVERGIDFNPANSEAESFCDFYSSKGWMVGKNKMKDWKAAVRNWLKNYKPSSSVKDNDTSWINEMDNLI